MPDRKLFYEDPRLFRLDTSVIETGDDDGRPWARLEETIFYPEGGGQPADRGTISGVPVLDVRSRGDEVLHFLERPVPPGPAALAIDAALRFDRMQQHTAQHLLTAVLLARHGLRTTAFHLGETYTAIEVPGSPPPAAMLGGVEDEVNEEIRRDRCVSTRWVQPEEMAALGVRSRGLPEGHMGPVRLVEIEGVDLNTCGGTHVARLGELQMLRILGAEAARGGARIRFLAGGRVLHELREAARLEAAVRERIGTAREEFPGVLDTWQAERKSLERRVRDLEHDLAGRIAAEIAADPSPRLCRFVGGAGPDFLRAVASAVLEARPDAVLALVGAGPDGRDPSVLVQSGPAGPDDVSGTGKRLCGILGAKGGGRGRTFQGLGGRWSGRFEVLDSLWSSSSD